MRRTPQYITTDAEVVKRLVRENPWATYVSTTAAGMVASHYATLLEDDPADPDAVVLVSHFGRPDEVAHELGRHEMLVIVQGPHGYISPGWYEPGAIVPTWNHVTAHLYGTPEILSAEDNYAVLERLVDHFEHVMPEPRALEQDPERMRRVALGTVGLRLRVSRFDARLKLSQNKSPRERATIMAALRGDGPYAHPALADEMARVASDPELVDRD
jgi:transcriptional regulator